MLVAADVAETDDGELAAARRCGKTGDASEASAMVWRVGCGQAWEMQMRERKTARVAPWIVESQDVTSCAAGDHLRRASATLTLAAKLDLKSSGMMTTMAFVQYCKGDGMSYVSLAGRGEGWEAVHVARARPAMLL